MPILILNMSGNLKGFEDQLCLDLSARINDQTTIITRRGENLLSERSVLGGDPYGVVVIVAHGCSLENSTTRVNIGLQPQNDQIGIERVLNTPTILTQILGRNPIPYVLVYCSCEALSIETFNSGIADPNCLGVVASREEIGFRDIGLFADIVNYLNMYLSRNVFDTQQFYSIVRNLSEQHGDFPLVRFLEVARVQIEE